MKANVAIQIIGPGNYALFEVVQVTVAAASQATAYYDWTPPSMLGTCTIMTGLLPPQPTAYATATILIS